MVGGERAAFERAEKVFKVMGATVTHVGAPGAGQTVKLCNQLVCAVNIRAVCEALALGRASGVDLDQMRDVLLGGSASSRMLDKLGPAMIAGDASAGFRIDLMLKDLRLVPERRDRRMFHFLLRRLSPRNMSRRGRMAKDRTATGPFSGSMTG